MKGRKAILISFWLLLFLILWGIVISIGGDKGAERLLEMAVFVFLLFMYGIFRLE